MEVLLGVEFEHVVEFLLESPRDLRLKELVEVFPKLSQLLATEREPFPALGATHLLLLNYEISNLNKNRTSPIGFLPRDARFLFFRFLLCFRQSHMTRGGSGKETNVTSLRPSEGA